MGNCKDCKHWQEGGDPEEGLMKQSRLIGAGICLRIKPFFESQEWDRRDVGELDKCGVTEVMHEIRISDASGDKAWAQDGEEYIAGLITTPDFGCVMFEES